MLLFARGPGGYLAGPRADLCPHPQPSPQRGREKSPVFLFSRLAGKEARGIGVKQRMPRAYPASGGGAFSTRTAHTLNSAIMEMGSKASIVSSLPSASA